MIAAAPLGKRSCPGCPRAGAATCGASANSSRAPSARWLVRRVVTSFGTRCDWQTERRYGGGYLLNWGPHIVDPPLLLDGSRVHTV